MGLQDKQEKHENANLSINQAIETLSNIADYKVDNNIDAIFPDKGFAHKKWSQIDNSSPSPEQAVELGKVTFRVVLDYLRIFYKKEYTYLNNVMAMDQIKSIMVIVGDAAKKLDKYTVLFHKKGFKRVTELREYKELQDFYKTKIAHQIDESVLGKWILGLSQKATQEATQEAIHITEKVGNKIDKMMIQTPKNFLIDIAGANKDTEYELFYMRKEDGTHFFNPKTIRNLKLICDFSDTSTSENPLGEVKKWQDFYLQRTAKEMISSIRDRLDHFYRQAFKFKNKDFVLILNKTLMALMLSSNPKNLMNDQSIKSCYDYFFDFISFLREVLNSDQYHKLLTYTPDSNDLGSLLLNITHTICSYLYKSLSYFKDFNEILKDLIRDAKKIPSKEHEEEAKATQWIWNSLASDYLAMSKLSKIHAMGPLNKILEGVRSGTGTSFDSLLQLTLPNQLYSLVMDGYRTASLHVPSPTKQEYIDKVTVLDEFKGFLRSTSSEQPLPRHLIINLQDRTSWREYHRCLALEDLQQHKNFTQCLSVVTLPKDTDFYHQAYIQDNDNHADVFINQFKEHLGQEGVGYYFSSDIKKAVLGSFSEGVMAAIHRIFFSNKNILLKEHRQAFIDIFDLFLILKVIEIVHPTSFSLTCKDGVDSASCQNALLVAFLKLCSGEPILKEDRELLDMILYAPAILTRERIVLQERFNRMINALTTIETVYSDLGPDMFTSLMKDAFDDFYKTPILHALIET